MNKQNEKHLGSDPDDIEDLLKTIEKSYNIRFEGIELTHIRTFGQLIDHIISKINFEHKDDCTDQQAFYKLRELIEKTKQLDKSSISPNTKLVDIFPGHKRRRDIREIEKQLGVNLQALRPSHYVTNSLSVLFFASIIGLFIDWQYGLTGIFTSIVGFWISNKTGNVFRDNTFGELTARMTQLNYAKSRRQNGTMNKKEIERKIQKLFIENLGLNSNGIDRDTAIF